MQFFHGNTISPRVYLEIQSFLLRQMYNFDK